MPAAPPFPVVPPLAASPFEVPGLGAQAKASGNNSAAHEGRRSSVSGALGKDAHDDLKNVDPSIATRQRDALVSAIMTEQYRGLLSCSIAVERA
jgi:hypothetical protein